MKKFILLLIVPFLSFGQYSTYYGTYNVNVNSTVNSTVRKTITTIDYGKLAMANAQREKNRIERLKIEDEKDRRQRLEIAMDPSLAFDYGTDKTYDSYTRSELESKKLKSLEFSYKMPHKGLFFDGGKGWVNNISENNIETRIKVQPSYNSFSKIINGEEIVKQKVSEYKVGELRSDTARHLSKKYIHKTEISRVNLCNNDAYVLIVVWEDDYEKGIDELYYSTVFDRNKKNGENYILKTRVQYRVLKTEEVSFEEIEGRRYYFRRLVKKLFSGLSISYEPERRIDIPHNQIGFIINPASKIKTHLFYGINYFNFFAGRYGLFSDFRFDFNSTAFIFNGGVAACPIKSKNTALIAYCGLGLSQFALRENGNSRWHNNMEPVELNMNFGLILQTRNIVSYQLGYDSSLPGPAKFNMGIGFSLE